ncbi:MAG TPA: hypothetical protein DCS43_00300 [Verrucomicrobia bacterium]|nr:hypothetical protein [Verrucomicrobiota bacterium]
MAIGGTGEGEWEDCRQDGEDRADRVLLASFADFNKWIFLIQFAEPGLGNQSGASSPHSKRAGRVGRGVPEQ